MGRLLYFSPLGYVISLVLNVIGILFRPFMIYGYWNHPTREFRRFTRVSSTAHLGDRKSIDISDYCWIGHHCVIDGSNGVILGEGVQLAFWVGIFSHGSEHAIRLHGRDYIKVSYKERIGYKGKPVTIGNYTYIGSGACVLPGTTIGQGCIVAAGSVVSSDVPDFAIVRGNPAEIIGNTLEHDRKFFRDKRVQESYFDKSVIEEYLSSPANRQEL